MAKLTVTTLHEDKDLFNKAVRAGISMQGYVSASKAQLIKLFGMYSKGADSKTTAEFVISFTVASKTVYCILYDYKEERAPSSNTQPFTWHVGSNNAQNAAFAIQHIEELLANSK